jgi:hypothetical protein
LRSRLSSPPPFAIARRARSSRAEWVRRVPSSIRRPFGSSGVGIWFGRTSPPKELQRRSAVCAVRISSELDGRTRIARAFGFPQSILLSRRGPNVTASHSHARRGKRSRTTGSRETRRQSPATSQQERVSRPVLTSSLPPAQARTLSSLDDLDAPPKRCAAR